MNDTKTGCNCSCDCSGCGKSKKPSKEEIDAFIQKFADYTDQEKADVKKALDKL
ncbi:hypothetical protein HN958_03315 [Candidatus Falkowbacteria bacterium]|nr:hypothetical protein [Candidatus Falkowbacteria bacterium]MBT7007506.1 hypothetical protein [Candidatus Falkowbacteria bacterium]